MAKLCVLTLTALWSLLTAADFGYPTGSRLGLFTAIQNIGGICALPLASYSADILGRRMGVSIGMVVVFIGIILQGLSLCIERNH
jgi:MFS family permease